MTKKKKRSAAGLRNYLKRGDKKIRLDVENNHNHDSNFNFQEMNASLDEIIVDNNNNIEQSNFKQYKHQETQTEWSDESYTPNTTFKTEIKKSFNFDNIRDLICVLFDSIENFNSKHRRILSVLIYLLLRLVSIQFHLCRDILDQLGLLNIKQCHSWLLTIIDEDDICVILRDNRGNHKRIKFYDNFPDLELRFGNVLKCIKTGLNILRS